MPRNLRVRLKHTCVYTWNTHMSHICAHVNTHIYVIYVHPEHTPVCSSDKNHVFSWNANTCPIGTNMCVHVNTPMCTRGTSLGGRIYLSPDVWHGSPGGRVHLLSPFVSFHFSRCLPAWMLGTPLWVNPCNEPPRKRTKGIQGVCPPREPCQGESL